MKKIYVSRLASQVVNQAKKQATRVWLVAGMLFVFGLTAFSQTNYYVITDSVAAGKAVKPNLIKAKFWSTNASVTGQRPNDFITDGQVFNIQVPGLSNTKDWAVYGVGSKIVVGTDTTTAGYIFTSTNPSNIDGVIDVKPNSSFIYQGLNTDSLTWGTLSVGSTVNFTGNQNGFQKVPAGNYYNLSLK